MASLGDRRSGRVNNGNKPSDPANTATRQKANPILQTRLHPFPPLAGHHQQHHHPQHDLHKDLPEVRTMGRQPGQHSVWAGLRFRAASLPGNECQDAGSKLTHLGVLGEGNAAPLKPPEIPKQRQLGGKGSGMVHSCQRKQNTGLLECQEGRERRGGLFSTCLSVTVQ